MAPKVDQMKDGCAPSTLGPGRHWAVVDRLFGGRHDPSTWWMAPTVTVVLDTALWASRNADDESARESG
jgi:hypothetical protein